MGSLTRLEKHTIGPYTNPVEIFTPPLRLFCFVFVVFWQRFKAYSGVYNIEWLDYNA